MLATADTRDKDANAVSDSTLRVGEFIRKIDLSGTYTAPIRVVVIGMVCGESPSGFVDNDFVLE